MKKPNAPKMRLVKEGDMKKTSPFWKEFTRRCAFSFSICILPCLVCNAIAVNYPTYLMWAFLISPALMVWCWYYNEFIPEGFL